MLERSDALLNLPELVVSFGKELLQLDVFFVGLTLEALELLDHSDVL